MKVSHHGFLSGAMLALAGLVLPLVSAHAGTIISGTASTGIGGNTFSISGSDFSMSGGGAANLGTGPCAPLDCAAPGTYSFFDGISSEATAAGISGSYTTGGTTYNYSCNQGTNCGGGIDFSGFLTVPDFGSTPPLVLSITTFFSSTGGIGGVGNPLNPDPSLAFTGSGIATITLHETSPGVYHFFSATYTFSAVPEPAFGSLAGIGIVLTGIGGLLASRSRKKAAAAAGCYFPSLGTHSLR
jgi:hypothetical protein